MLSSCVFWIIPIFEVDLCKYLSSIFCALLMIISGEYCYYCLLLIFNYGIYIWEFVLLSYKVFLICIWLFLKVLSGDYWNFTGLKLLFSNGNNGLPMFYEVLLCLSILCLKKMLELLVYLYSSASPGVYNFN